MYGLHASARLERADHGESATARLHEVLLCELHRVVHVGADLNKLRDFVVVAVREEDHVGVGEIAMGVGGKDAVANLHIGHSFAATSLNIYHVHARKALIWF